MKINGTPVREIVQPSPFPSFTLYQVTLKGGPCDAMPSIAGNTTVVFSAGHRYELNSDGDFVYSPQGQN